MKICWFNILGKMAASLARSSRAAVRLLVTRAAVQQQRGYADEMAFTFASANKVSSFSSYTKL